MKKLSAMFLCISLSATTVIGCRSNDGVKPTIKTSVENLEVKTLKTYYAKVAKVELSAVIYNSSTDLFSIKGNYIISHSELLKYYNNSLTGRIQ